MLRSLVFAQSYVDLPSVARPNPEPALPSGFDAFAPPVVAKAPAAGAPTVAEWTRLGAPDSPIALTASQLSTYTGTGTGTDTRFEVFGQGKSGSYLGIASIQALDGAKAALVLPTQLPANSEYLVWAVNAAGMSYPVAVNATEAWWIGPNAATRGDTVSVYGRNLVLASGTSYIYIQKSGAPGAWAKVTAANPYKVDFTVPANLADGTYQVWAHNGHGGHDGWSGPLTLTVNEGMPWTAQTFNVKSYGAKGDGVTDDEGGPSKPRCRRRPIAPWSTVYLPAGTYMVSRGFNVLSKMRWLGAGATKTFIKANAGFVTPASWDARRYCLFFSSQGSHDIAFQNLTIAANGDLNGYLPEPIYMRFGSDFRFTNVTINAQGYSTADFHGSVRLAFQDCTMIGGGNGIFFGTASQVQIEGCHIYGTNDVNTMLTFLGRRRPELHEYDGAGL